MTSRDNIKRQIRGWFPQDPQISTIRMTQKQTKPAWASTLNAISTLVIVLGFLASFFVLSTSWVQYVIIVVAVIGVLFYVVARRRFRIKRIIKHIILPVMIFSLCFTAVEFVLFWYAGYPATYSATEPNVTVSMQSLLNASVVDIVKGVERSTSFDLLKLEHGNDIVFESLTLTPTSNGSKGGYVSVDFNSQKSEHYIHFYSGNGHQYGVQVGSGNQQMMHYFDKQKIDQSLYQIDSRGLSWFYNQALQIAENRTADFPTVDSLTVNLVFQDTSEGYEGLVVQVIGYHQMADNDWANVLISAFQPDGELIYMTKPM